MKRESIHGAEGVSERSSISTIAHGVLGFTYVRGLDIIFSGAAFFPKKCGVCP
jgi:hypothetical protein